MKWKTNGTQPVCKNWLSTQYLFPSLSQDHDDTFRTLLVPFILQSTILNLQVLNKGSNGTFEIHCLIPSDTCHMWLNQNSSLERIISQQTIAAELKWREQVMIFRSDEISTNNFARLKIGTFADSARSFVDSALSFNQNVPIFYSHALSRKHGKLCEWDPTYSLPD